MELSHSETNSLPPTHSPRFVEPEGSLSCSQEPQIRILRQMNPGHILTPNLFEIHFNIFLPSTSRCLQIKCLFPSGFRTENAYEFLIWKITTVLTFDIYIRRFGHFCWRFCRYCGWIVLSHHRPRYSFRHVAARSEDVTCPFFFFDITLPNLDIFLQPRNIESQRLLNTQLPNHITSSNTRVFGCCILP
jgi:hypothetical protein